MHFYYFLYIFTSDFADFAVFTPYSVLSAVSRCHSFGCRTLTCQPWGVVRCGYPHGLPAA